MDRPAPLLVTEDIMLVSDINCNNLHFSKSNGNFVTLLDELTIFFAGSDVKKLIPFPKIIDIYLGMYVY